MGFDNTAIRLVIAIDFGTSRSGFAYSFKSTLGTKLGLYVDWPGQPRNYVKTLTYALYNPDTVLDSWGYEARNKLAMLRNHQKARPYHLLRYFKMALHEGEQKTPNNWPIFVKNAEPYLRTDDGKEFSVIKVIAEYLSAMKDLALEHISEKASVVLQPHEILWCLTVPAIWTDKDKQSMRRAAERAGLIKAGDPTDAERLIFALEPEAAAIYCSRYDNSIHLSKLAAGNCFMVVDAGGGTADITVHTLGEGKGIFELALEADTPSAGGAYGSSYVDREFVHYVERLFTPELLRTLSIQENLIFIELMDHWERAKCHFNPQETEPINIPLDVKLHRWMQQNDPAALKRLAELQGGDDDHIQLEPDTMAAFFQPAIEGIIREVDRQFARLQRQGKTCDYLFLVGGFAESPLLKQKIKDRFAGKVKKIIIPQDPGASVVAGAVSFGIDPTLIRSRLSRLTYGSGVLLPFDPSKDPLSKRVPDEKDGGFRCEKRFSIFVCSGEKIETGEVRQMTTYPIKARQKDMLIPFYATKRGEVRYTDESHCRHIGELTIERADTSSGFDWPVEVTMNFGDTEIKVSARDVKTGKEVKTKLEFSSTYFPEFIDE